MLSFRELDLILGTLKSSSLEALTGDWNRFAEFLNALLNLQSVPDEGIKIFLQNIDWINAQIDLLSVKKFRTPKSDSDILKLAFVFAYLGATESAAYDYLHSLTENRYKQLSTKLLKFIANLKAHLASFESCLHIVLDRPVAVDFNHDTVVLLLIHYYTEGGRLVPEPALRFVESHFRLDCPFLLTYLAGLIMRHPVVFQNSYHPDLPNCWNNDKQYRVMCMLDNFANLPGGLL